MKGYRFLYTLLFVLSTVIIIAGNSGCAQIGAITGGPRDSLPPVLVSATPQLRTTNFTGKKITLTFDEYIADLQDVQTNLLVSPYPKVSPEITNKLKTLTIKLKDTLLPNTTYSIKFGNIIKDANENNVYKNFIYVFSTGTTIDSLTLSGRVELAETGKTDSTIVVMLYRNAVDSTVQNFKPNYMAFVDSSGHFTFSNLPPGTFNIYALKDGDGGKTYNSKSELFAFADKPITIGNNNDTIQLYAYAEEKAEKNGPTLPATKPKNAAAKKFKYTASAAAQRQDLRQDLVLEYNSAIKTFDSSKIILTDTNYAPIAPVAYFLDSNKIILKTKWKEDEDYRLIVNKTAVRDSLDSTVAKTDTIRFKTKKEDDYGSLVLRFSNIDLSKHPVLQFVQQDVIKESFPLTTKEWHYKLFPPGDYELRILYDDNNNGKWDPAVIQKRSSPKK
ncbi:MAG: Ig-like domain-containing domain [Ferruginibacter sp.]